MPVPCALAYIENGAARYVVIDNAVRQTIELVALAHKLAAYGIYFRGCYPIGGRLLVNPDQHRSKHQAREVHNGNIRHDAVIVVRIARSHG
jgi:hypothetical protein